MIKMELKKIIGLMGLLAVVAIGAMIVSYSGFVGNVVSFPMSAQNPSGQEIKYGSSVCVYHNDELVFCKSNTLTNIGMNTTVARLAGYQGAPFNYISVGNLSAINASTVTLGDGDIAECGLSRSQDTAVANIGDGNWSWSYKFTSTCGGILVNTTALFNNTYANANTTFAGATFSNDVTLQSADELNVTWFIFVVT